MSAALIGGGAVAGAAVGGPVGAAVGALVGWIVGRGLAPSDTPVAMRNQPPSPRRKYVGELDVASQADCPEGMTFWPYSRQADSRGDCRPPEPTCGGSEKATWTLIQGQGMGWQCRDPDRSYPSGFSGACGPGMTSNPLPVGPQCLPTSESAYTSGGPNRSPFSGLIAGPRVSK